MRRGETERQDRIGIEVDTESTSIPPPAVDDLGDVAKRGDF
jgi:hypothetical protein